MERVTATRALVVGFAVWGSAVMGLAACGETKTTDTTTDPPVEPGADAAQEASINGVEVPDLVVYAGQVASLDARGSSATGPIAYNWVVKSAPATSAVKTASLAGTTTAQPSFTTDAPGTYELEVTATVGGATAKKVVTVKALDPQIFYLQINAQADAQATLELRAVGASGANARAVACRRKLGSSDGGDNPAAVVYPAAEFWMDSFEGTPGAPARAIFPELSTKDGGDLDIALQAVTEETSCANPPPKIRAITGPKANLYQPRFSPNGRRIVYIETSDGDAYTVSAVGFDGTEYRQLSSYCATSDAGNCWGGEFGPRRPQWLDANHIGWVRVLKEIDVDGGQENEWEILTVTDSDNPQPTSLMRCTTVGIPTTIAFLPNGKVLAALRRTTNVAQDLLVLSADAMGKCVFERNLTNLSPRTAWARDFALSPDGKHVAFVKGEAAADAQASNKLDVPPNGDSYVYVVPVDGTQAPEPVSGKQQIALFGPRWIAGGATISWNGAKVSGDAGDGGVIQGANEEDASVSVIPGVAVAPFRGNTVSFAALGDPDAGTIVMMSGNGGRCGCNLVTVASPLPGLLTGGATALAFLARRLTRKRRDESKRGERRVT